MERTALLIEDSPDWLRILRDELLRAGFRIDWASERTEALAKLADPLFPYGLVVLDPHLGDDLGAFAGTSIAEAAVRMHPGVPLVVVSGLMDPSELEKAFQPFAAAVKAYFVKTSFVAADFRETLYTLGGSPRRADALFLPDRDALQLAWRDVQAASSNVDKGTSLEEFARILLGSIPLLTFVEKRAVTPTGEIDLVFNVTALPGTLCQEWGRLILVECRNRVSKLDAPAVGVFREKLEEAGCQVGIVLSLAGLSGRGDRDAVARIRSAFERWKMVILVLDGGDLERIVDGSDNLYETLERKYTAVRLRQFTATP